jgi:hypothetical protein
MATYRIWTIQMSKWRIAKASGITLLNSTAKDGHKFLAPDYGVVMQYKRGEVSEEEYTKIYLDRMEHSRSVCPNKWAALMRLPLFAIACYCPSGVFCHRHLLKNDIKDYLEKQGHTVILEGELVGPVNP